MTHALTGEGFDASEDGTGRGTPLAPIAFGWQNSSAQGASASEHHSPTLDKSKVPAIAFSCKDHAADASDDLAPTLRAMNHSDSHANAGGQMAVAIQERAKATGSSGPQGKGWQDGLAFTMEARNRVQNVATPASVRRLTPRECERLQGFPDDYTLIRYRSKPAADGPRYKALGNSWAVPCVRWIGARIKAVEQIKRFSVSASRSSPAG